MKCSIASILLGLMTQEIIVSCYSTSSPVISNRRMKKKAKKNKKKKAADMASMTPITPTDMSMSSPHRWLQILHSSDNESQFYDIDILEYKASEYAKLSSGLMDLAMAEDMKSIHVTAGDHTLPGPFYQASSEVPAYGKPGLADIAIFNAVGLDANGVGNHEFDGGIDDFAFMLSMAEYPFVTVNLDFSSVEVAPESPPIVIGEDGADCAKVGGTIVKSCYIDLEDYKVGIIGRSPAEFFNVIANPSETLPGLDFFGEKDGNNQPLASAVPMVLEQVDILESQGIDIIVLLDHAQDWTGDPLSANILRGIDVIVAAGSTGFMASSNPIGAFNALREGDVGEAEYPTVRTDMEGDTVLVINSDQLFLYIGQLMVKFDEDGKIISWDGRSGPIATLSDVVDTMATDTGYDFSNEEVDAIIDALASTPSIIDDFFVIGTTQYPLNGARADVRSKETNLARIVADSTLWGGQMYMDTVGGATIDIALKNGGGIRNSINGPNVFRFGVKSALAFNNKLSIVELDIFQLVACFENAVSRYPAMDGRYPQVAGLKMEYDPTMPGVEGLTTLDTPSRIMSLIVGESDVVIENNQIVGDTSRTFVIATNSFLLTGGDGYVSIAAGNVLGETPIGEQQILEDYIVEIMEGQVDLMDPPVDTRLITL